MSIVSLFEVAGPFHWTQVTAFVALATGTAVLNRARRLGVTYRTYVGRGVSGRAKSLALARAIRAGLVGAALVGLGAGLLLNAGWLVVLSLIIGAEELLACSVMAAALRDEQRRRTGPERKLRVFGSIAERRARRLVLRRSLRFRTASC